MGTRRSLFSVAVVTFCSTMVLAEDSPPTPPAGDTAALFDQAEQQMAAGDHAAAVATYRQLLDQLPLSNRAQQAAFKAAACYEALGQPRDAVEMYERTVSIGRDLLKPRYYKIDGQKQNVPVGKPESVKDRLERSLKRQAILCQGLGDSAKGLEAIRYLAAFAPTSPTVAALIPLQLEFEGRPASEATELVRQQEQAADLYRRAREALSANGREAGIALLDHVLADYPDTPAAIRARADKAEILWLNHRYAEAREIYQTIIDEIGQTAPDVNSVRTARYRIAWHDLTRLLKASQLQVRSGSLVPDSQWQQVRDACKVVMELDPDPVDRAQANVCLIEVYSWQGRHEDVLAAVRTFFRDYGGSRGAQNRLFRQMSWARLYKGDALEHLGHPGDAAREYRAILRWSTEHADAMRDEKVVERAALRLNNLSTQQ